MAVEILAMHRVAGVVLVDRTDNRMRPNVASSRSSDRAVRDTEVLDRALDRG